MSEEVEGFPSELASVELASGSARIELDEALYPLDAIYGAAYVFIDRCFVLLDRPRAGIVRANLSPKKRAESEQAQRQQLHTLVGEFANELLSCAWRAQITRENKALIEQVTVQAIAGAMGPPSLEDLAKFDFTAEPLEDPLGIAMSWEEKHKKKTESEK